MGQLHALAFLCRVLRVAHASPPAALLACMLARQFFVVRVRSVRCVLHAARHVKNVTHKPRAPVLPWYKV